MKIETDIVYGATYRDAMTGYEGVATGVSDYVTGCLQVLLVPRYKRGVRESSRWLDEQRLRRVGRKVVKLPPRKGQVLQVPGADISPPTEGVDDDDVAPDERE